MGIFWKTAMPLLSTLAALVIIVNSAEEDLETDRRYDLRPRLLDTGTPNYDQPWRAIETEPEINQPTPAQVWDDSPLEPPKRRRPVRKRKRRPMSTEDVAPPEKQPYPEENQRFHESDYNTAPTTEMPRRRRKRPETRRNRWTDEYLETERPLRRRGQRRKRPSMDAWPLLSEFNEYRSDENPPEVVRTEQNDPLKVEDNEKRKILKEDWFSELRDDKDIPEPVAQDPFIQATLEEQDEKLQLKEDKSLSDFSMEVLAPVSSTYNNGDIDSKISRKLKEKSPEMEELFKAQEKGPIDPLTLKDILKRSNGTSLSEILQQHNLSLTDLLHGRENALSVLKLEDSLENHNGTPSPELQVPSETKDITEINIKDEIITEDRTNLVTTELAVGITNSEVAPNNQNETNINRGQNSPNSQETLEVKENAPKIALKRRFNGTIRRKLRMRPMLNNTLRGQSNRDLMALTARKYAQNSHRNNSTSKEWKNVIPSMANVSEMIEESSKTEVIETISTTIIPDESTVVVDIQTESKSKLHEVENVDMTEVSVITTLNPTTTEVNPIDKPKLSRISRPTVNRMGLRRQAFNNRLKKKRMKQKNSTTEPPIEQDNFMEDLFGMPNLVSSSEFIARTQIPSKSQDDEEQFTTLDNFMTTETTRNIDNRGRIYSSTPRPVTIQSTTEETAKFEIEEILNDTQTSARLSRILMERNMTLTELLEHRERGSSHIHLADIFHNASKEPNPPEPFLSKSLIEPISKETYPLRALLEANLHDPTAKATTIDPSQSKAQFKNIPVVMDFGNNVNENGENMGIISLFNKFTGSDTDVEKSIIKKDSEGVPYVTTVMSVNTTNTSDSVRESRVLKEDEVNIKHDVLSWNELFTLMRKQHKNDTEEAQASLSTGLSSLESSKNVVLDDDKDGDGLIVLEDLQHLKDFNSNIAAASEEKLAVNTNEKFEIPTREPGTLNHIPSHTRSVTVATASIVGLAMILFLLTYAAFKWKQQRKSLSKKQSFSDERIPTPVFENRKGQKNNCSTRSISPMLASSNIYTMNTLDQLQSSLRHARTLPHSDRAAPEQSASRGVTSVPTRVTEMAQPRRIDTIVVNELLAFVQNKLDVMDELSLEQICLSSYTEAEIYGAKVVLNDTALTTARLLMRKKDGNGKKDLRDIFRVFKETDPDDVPTYVAKDLNKLPPVTFDHVDVTRLLKDIQLLRADITDIRGKLEASEQAGADMRRVLTSLRNANVAHMMTPRADRGVQCDTVPVSTTSPPTNTGQLKGNDPPTPKPRFTAPPPALALCPATVPTPPRPQRDSYAQVSRRPRRRPHAAPPAACTRRAPPAPPPAPARGPPNVVPDADGYVVVENRKRRQRRNRNKRGTVPAASTNLKAATPTTSIYLSRLDAATTPEDVMQHIRARLRGRTGESISVECAILESIISNNFRACRLRVPTKHQGVFLSPDFWPEGVVFRRYREAKTLKPPKIVCV